MKEITEAIKAKRAQIKALETDIETLLRADRALRGGTSTTAKATPTAKREQRGMSAAAKKAVSRRMKAYWAKRKK